MLATSHERLTPHQRRLALRSLFGCLVGLVGIANMLSVFVPKPNWDIFFGVWPADIHHGVHKLFIVCGFFLLMLSYGVMRGKRQAWYAVVLLLLLLALLYVLSGGPVLAMLVMGLITCLVFLARFFRAKSDPPSVRRGQLAFLLGLGIVTVYTIGGFFFLYQEFEPLVDHWGIGTVILLVLRHAHLHLPYGSQAFFFEHALPPLCLSAVIYGIVLILRPVTATLHTAGQEKKVASALTRLFGTNSISYFALEFGKAYFFSASGKSVISYVVEGNVAVVVGDPIGPEEEAQAVIQQFVDFCWEQGWTMVFWQVREVLLDAYRAAGLHSLKIGEDAIVETNAFTLTGKAMANVRSSAKHAEKAGICIAFYRGRVHNDAQLAQMEIISQKWLARKGGSEMGFSMGRFEKHGDCEQITAVAISPTNRVHAFVTFVPIYGRKGWGLDLMRRAEQAAPGTMELLIARSIDYLKENDAALVSLGLAPLNNVSHTEKTFLQNSVTKLSHLLGSREKNQTLFNFKKKFQPRWESRYLVFSSTLTLPKIGWALYRAHQHDASLLKAFYKTVRAWRRERLAMHHPGDGEKRAHTIISEVSL